MRNHIRVKYKPARYHQGGECIVVQKPDRALGRDFKAYVSDDLLQVSKYVEDQMARGKRWDQI